MAGYRTEQINIGSIAAPDVGKALIDYAGLTNDYYQQGLSNTKAGIELARQQVADQRAAELFNRQTNEYNREVGLRKAKQDITKDFMNNQSAYGGQPLHDRLNDAINAESQRRLSTPEVGELDALVARQDKGETLTPQELARKDEIAKKITFSPEESTRLQKESESIVPFQEDAKAMLAAKYAAAGIDNAHALAADATGGLISRAALQEQADKNREVNQKYYDELLKARREYGKDLVEVDKVNAKAENDKAEKVFEMLRTVYGTGGGTGSGSSGGGIGGVTLADAQKAVEGLDLGWSDTGDAYKLLNKGIAEGLTPGQTLKAIKNARDVGVTAGISASEIDEKLFDAQIENAKKFGIPGQAGYDVTKISNRLNEADYAPTYIPRERVGYDTKEMDARIARNLPFLHAGQPEVPTNGIVDKTIVDKNSDYASKVRKSEGNYTSINKESGALGAYQFLPSTLDGLRKQTGEKFTNEEFLKNPSLQDKYFGLLTKSNAGRLEALGIRPTETNLYMAHNLGPGYVKEMQNLDTPPSQGLEKALKANRLKDKEDWYERNKKYTGNSVKDLFNNIEKTKEESDKVSKYIDKVKELQSVNNGGILDDIGNKSRAIADTGITREKADLIDKELEESRRSDANIARARYLALKNQPEGTRLSGKTKDEWFDVMSSKDRLGAYVGPMAPVVAAAPLALAALPSTVPGTSLMVLPGSEATTISGGLGRTGQLFPKVSELFSKPLTKESIAELQSISKKVPELKDEIIKQLQRMGVK